MFMTVKEYLSQAFILHRLMKAKESRIRDLRDMQECISRMNTGIKVQNNLKPDKTGDITVELLDQINECQKDCFRLISVQREIVEIIEAVEREDYRLILFERYVNLKRWEDVAADNDYSEKHVYKLHSAALAQVKLDTP